MNSPKQNNDMNMSTSNDNRKMNKYGLRRKTAVIGEKARRRKLKQYEHWNIYNLNELCSWDIGWSVYGNVKARLAYK